MFRHALGQRSTNPIASDFDGNVTLVKMLPLLNNSELLPARCEESGCNSSVEFLRQSCEDSSFVDTGDAEMTDIHQMTIKSQDSFVSACSQPASTPIGLARQQQQQQQQQQFHCPAEMQRRVQELRRRRPRKFYQLCRSHLSFVTDVPPDFLQDLIDSCQSGKGASSSSSGSSSSSSIVHRVCKSVRRAVDSEQQQQQQQQQHSASSATSASCESANSEILGTVDRLIELLDDRLDEEGIFRKSGQVGRQRQLRRLLPNSDVHQLRQSVLDLQCCVHDIATVLKACLAELQQPLLTERLQPYFLQLTELTALRADISSNSVAPAVTEAAIVSGRQLRGFQILLQLLPQPNANLLRRLLLLLRRVAALPRTLMTPENLGCVFGPLLLCPRQLKQQDSIVVQRMVQLANEAVAYMIRRVDEIFTAPPHLSLDASRAIDKLDDRSRRSRDVSSSVGSVGSVGRFADQSTSSAASSAVVASPDEDNDESLSANSDDEAVDLCVTFVDRRSRAVDSGDYTRLQVAQLYAAVQAMPDSAKKRALVRRFSAANGGLTPDSKGFARPAVAASLNSPAASASASASASSPSSAVGSPFNRSRVCPRQPPRPKKFGLSKEATRAAGCKDFGRRGAFGRLASVGEAE